MKHFKHINVRTTEDAITTLNQYQGKAAVIAGGTDLLGQIKDEILPELPEVIVNLKTIPGLNDIKEEGGMLKIGALTRLEDIAKNKVVKNRYTAIAEAAGKTASPHLREMGTIGGNICQSVRCWYYWVPENRFNCMRKGGKVCYAMIGDDRYHSIFGAKRLVGTPCSTSCPNNVDIPLYLKKFRDGDILGAARTILERNPLPAITGRVCPHFCENECNRSYVDSPISIRSVERFLGDYILDHCAEIISLPQTKSKKNMAIVGSGPAGLSAGYYLRQYGHDVTIFERKEEAGGMLMYAIPPYRLPKTFVRKQVSLLETIGIKFKYNANLGKDIKVEELIKSFDAVLLALGAWGERCSDIKGEHLITSGLDFLGEVNLGARKAVGQKVAVIGGGNVAIDVARTLIRMGSEPIILYRRGETDMPALEEEAKRAREEGVAFKFLTQPIEVYKRGSELALTCLRIKPGPLDETGRPEPLPIEGSEFTVEADTVVAAIGEKPDRSGVPMEFIDEKGELKTNLSTYNLGANLFAGGDFVSGPGTVAEAIASGRMAAVAINQNFSGLGKETEEKDFHDARQPLNFKTNCLRKMNRAEAPELSVSERIGNLNTEDVIGLDLSEVELEANRCLNCGCVAVHPSDMAPTLIALNANIVTTKRKVEAEKFFAVEGDRTTILDDDEIVTEIQVPTPINDSKSKFLKFAVRKAIDFPIVNCAVSIQNGEGAVKAARVCLNAVYHSPYRAMEAEKYIIGRTINESTAEAASVEALKGACAIKKNKYKISIARELIKRAIVACSTNP